MNMQHQRTDSTDSTGDGIRKRVGKACDRCRMKKSKCDGAHPCSRCFADNTICVFGERKKSHDKVYPKGYVEMLEQQQGQLVAALQEMYRRARAGKHWSGPILAEPNGYPLTHDILKSLDLLEPQHDGSEHTERFEEDFEKLRSRLVAGGAPLVKRRDSCSSDSEHSQHGRAIARHRRAHKIPKPLFDTFTLTPSPSPLSQSPAPLQRQFYPPAQQSPLHQSSPVSNNDPRLFEPEWSLAALSQPEAFLRSNHALQTPQLQDLDAIAGSMEDQGWNDAQFQYTVANGFIDQPQQLDNFYTGLSAMQAAPEFPTMLDEELQSWVSVGS